jgi:hypothetical protein
MAFEWRMSDTCHDVDHGIAQALPKVFVPLSAWEYPVITGFSPTVLNSPTFFYPWLSNLLSNKVKITTEVTQGNI